MKITYETFGAKSINFCCISMSEAVLDVTRKVFIARRFDKDFNIYASIEGMGIRYCPFCNSKIEAVKLAEKEDN